MNVEKLDVLAILRAAASDLDCRCGHPNCSKQRERSAMLAARDVISELINAARAVSGPGITDVEMFERLPRLRAAVASLAN